MTSSIWVAVSGEYSDFRVHCAFPSQEEAERFVARANRNDRPGDDEGAYAGWETMELPLYAKADDPKLVSLWAQVNGSDEMVSYTGWEFDVMESGTWRFTQEAARKAAADADAASAARKAGLT